jgi:hypothetical protein
MQVQNMPTLATIQTAAIAIAAFISLAICSALISANVRRLANEKGWDAFFLLAWNIAPAWGRKMLSGWLPLRQLWWLWLSFGMSGGLGIALWLLAPVPMPVSTSAAVKAIAPIQSELDAAKAKITGVTAQLDAKTKEADDTKHQLESARAASIPIGSPALPPKSPLLGIDDAKQWQIIKSIQDISVDDNGNMIDCPSVQSIDSQNKTAIDLFSEFYPVLHYSWWRANIQGALPPPHQPFGIEILVGDDKGNSYICAKHLVGLLQNVLPIPVSFRKNQVTDNLAKCDNKCVEIRYGGER